MSSAGSESRAEATFLGYKLLSQPAATNAHVPILMDALAMARWILHEPPLWTFGVRMVPGDRNARLRHKPNSSSSWPREQSGQWREAYSGGIRRRTKQVGI